MIRVSEAPKLPIRDPRGHKGTFGTAAVLGGCAHEPGPRGIDGLRMLGGPCFTAMAALRAGCGLARLALPAPLVDHGLTLCPSATGLALAVDADGRLKPHLAAEAVDALVAQAEVFIIGPGLGRSEGASAAVLRAVGQESCPVVVDADGLNALAEIPELGRDFRAAAVLTPHPGEYARLAASLGLAEETLPEARAGALARRLGCVVVLKGAATAVSDGHRAWVHDQPNPALGTAGTGDVLAGLLGGLVAQHARATGGAGGVPLFDLARAAVLAHAEAGARWSEARHARGGLLATDLLEQIPATVESLRATSELNEPCA